MKQITTNFIKMKSYKQVNTLKNGKTTDTKEDFLNEIFLKFSIEKREDTNDIRGMYIIYAENKKGNKGELYYKDNTFDRYVSGNANQTIHQIFKFANDEEKTKFLNYIQELEDSIILEDKMIREKELANIDLSNFEIHYYPNYGSKSSTDLPAALKEYEEGLIALIKAKEIELEAIAYSDTKILKNISIEKLQELAKRGNEILEAKEIKKAEKEAEKKQKIKDAIAKAKATGEKQVINAYSYENKYSECITVYEMIDGNGYVTKVKDNAY